MNSHINRQRYKGKKQNNENPRGQYLHPKCHASNTSLYFFGGSGARDQTAHLALSIDIIAQESAKINSNN